MTCECKILDGAKAIFCTRRNKHVTCSMWKNCQADSEAVDHLHSAAESTLKVLESLPPNERKAYSLRPGVGTELKKSLAWIAKIKPATATCNCENLAAEMDKEGVKKCRERREYYVGRMLENKTAICEAMKAEGGINGMLGAVAGVVPHMIAVAWIGHKFDAACDAAEVKKKQPTPRPRRQAAGKSFGSAFRSQGVPRFLTSQQFQIDIKTLVGKIPPDVTAIAGVARSGLSAATMISMYLHLPMFTVRQTANDITATGNGWRIGKNTHVHPNRGRVLVVDDTVMTGNSLRAIEPLLQREFPDYLTAAVYVNPLAVKKPDIWAVDLAWPHLLEWNLFNSVLSPNMACDFDGILCRDCLPGQDDDGKNYLDFINNAKPLYLPRKVPIPLIVTARIEKYRQPTMDWLSRHGIKVNRLVMHPAATLAERNRDNIAAYKARHFQAWAKTHRASPPPLAFIESDDRQAQQIAAISKLMVICPGSGRVY